MLLLYILFLSIDLSKLKSPSPTFALRCQRSSSTLFSRPVRLSAGQIFLPGSLDIRIGLLMLLVTCRLVSVFTGLGKGNVELGMSILPLNLILQIVLRHVPVSADRQ